MDPIRSAFWEAFRHLFPPHARAVQTDAGCLLVSWSMRGDPHAQFANATPITLRFEDDLLELMNAASADQRRRIAARQEPLLRAGLVGYDPYAQIPNSRVIVLG